MKEDEEEEEEEEEDDEEEEEIYEKSEGKSEGSRRELMTGATRAEESFRAAELGGLTTKGSEGK